VGLWPNAAETPLPVEALAARPAVFDIIYRPPDTRLLREARQAGCTTITGVDMFVHQAAAQYQIWTGRQPDLDWMTRMVRECLSQGATEGQP
jgi:shikimate 5-dehydrogenase